MITLSWALRDIVKSGYHLFYANNHEEKKKEMETLILGMTKIAVIFFTSSLLYSPCFSTERRNQWILTGLAFCIHPVAVIDIIGTRECVLGISEGVKSLRMCHQLWKEPSLRMIKEAKEQAKREGYPRNANSITGWFHFKTRNRLREILETIKKRDFNESEWAQLEATALTAKKYFISACNHLGITTLSILCAVNIIPIRPTEPRWLDQKMVDFSKWAASRFV